MSGQAHILLLTLFSDFTYHIVYSNIPMMVPMCSQRCSHSSSILHPRQIPSPRSKRAFLHWVSHLHSFPRHLSRDLSDRWQILWDMAKVPQEKAPHLRYIRGLEHPNKWDLTTKKCGFRAWRSASASFMLYTSNQSDERVIESLGP